MIMILATSMMILIAVSAMFFMLYQRKQADKDLEETLGSEKYISDRSIDVD